MTDRPSQFLDGPETASLWLWILSQAGVLALFAGRVRVTSGYPEPIEATADVAVACWLVIAAALLGQRLFGRMQATLRAFAAAGLFATLAALLAGRPIFDTLRLMIVTGLWLWAIGILTRSPAGRLAAAFGTIAGPVIYYCRLEFGPNPGGQGNASTWLSPTLGICTTIFHPASFWPAIVPIGVIGAFWAAKCVQKRRSWLRPLQLP